MRLIILVVALVTILNPGVKGQNENRFRNFHGIKQPGNDVTFFEAEGYNIFIQQVSAGLDKKGISKVMRTYSAKGAVVTTDSAILGNNRVLLKSREKAGVTAYFIYYLLGTSDTTTTTVIGFTRSIARDENLEKAFVNSYILGRIPSFVYSGMSTDTVDFVGRSIEFGPVCRWMSPHNIQCADFGQMNWAVFDDLKTAEQYRDMHYQQAKNKKLMKVMHEEWIPVLFEGQETTALRATVKIQLPMFLLGVTNTLIVYFVTAQVRRKYVTCILSQYAPDDNDFELAPLLADMLIMKGEDGTWQDSKELTDSEPVVVEEKAERLLNRDVFKIETGIWVPLGNLQKSVGVSPHIGLWWGGPFRHKKHMRFDVGMSVFIPQNRRKFEYQLPDSVMMAKMSFSGVIGFQVTNTKEIPDSHILNYIDQVYGVGYGGYSTGIKKPKEDPEAKQEYYSIDFIQLSYGLTMRKKVFKDRSIGMSFRYNYAPVRLLSQHVKKGFGNSSITAGLQIRL